MMASLRKLLTTCYLLVASRIVSAEFSAASTSLPCVGDTEVKAEDRGVRMKSPLQWKDELEAQRAEPG